MVSVTVFGNTDADVIYCNFRFIISFRTIVSGGGSLNNTNIIVVIFAPLRKYLLIFRKDSGLLIPNFKCWVVLATF